MKYWFLTIGYLGVFLAGIIFYMLVRDWDMLNLMGRIVLSLVVSLCIASGYYFASIGHKSN